MGKYPVMNIIKTVLPVLVVLPLIYLHGKEKAQAQQVNAGKHPPLKLELVSIKQLQPGNKRQLDLSGMVYYRDMVLAIADKEWDRYIYRINDRGKYFSCDEFYALCPSFRLDLEGIEAGINAFYFIEEYTSDVYEVNPGSCKMSKVPIPWSKYGIDRSGWGNAGLEGIAYDKMKGILYLAKERDPVRLFRLDIGNMDITEPFTEQLGRTGVKDISELKYEKDFIYFLERADGKITRLNIRNGEMLSASFFDYEYKNGMRLYMNSNPQYGMAEAFIFKGKEIWIGLDNNGKPVSEYGRSMGLDEGNRTVILIFKRPEGF